MNWFTCWRHEDHDHDHDHDDDTGAKKAKPAKKKAAAKKPAAKKAAAKKPATKKAKKGLNNLIGSGFEMAFQNRNR